MFDEPAALRTSLPHVLDQEGRKCFALAACTSKASVQRMLFIGVILPVCMRTRACRTEIMITYNDHTYDHNRCLNNANHYSDDNNANHYIDDEDDDDDDDADDDDDDKVMI